MSNLRVGSVVHEGDRLGAIIPQGGLKAVAYFPPGVALGRIRVDQAAQLRLDGFPWTQYGTISMAVANISNEARDGQIRIEFKVKSDATTRIPLQYGLTGAVEVEVDQLSPAALLLRIIGKRLGSPAPA
jgi:membrane fusion protein (multidrug efflux system)